METLIVNFPKNFDLNYLIFTLVTVEHPFMLFKNLDDRLYLGMLRGHGNSLGLTIPLMPYVAFTFI